MDTKLFCVALGCLFVALIVCGLIIEKQTSELYDVSGKVVNVAYSRGSWSTSDLTTIYFEDGRILVIQRLVLSISLGKTYIFHFRRTATSNDVFLDYEELL